MSEIRDPICRIVRATRLLLVLLVLLPRSAAAATIAISLASRADTIEIEGSAELNADPETAWRVLTDYERYVDFIPGLQESRVVARNGATVTVEQTGNVELWKLHMPLDVTFEITEMAPTGLVSRVVARQSARAEQPLCANPRRERGAPRICREARLGTRAVWRNRAACGQGECRPPLPGARRRDGAPKRCPPRPIECQAAVESVGQDLRD